MNLYDQQKKNLGNTRLFIAFFVVLLALMGLGADGLLYAGGFSPGIPFATLGAIAVGGMSAWWSLREGDKAVLQSTGAIPIDRNDPKQRVLENVVEEIAIAGGIPKPAIYVVPDSDPNAFATGVGPERASIAVTRGLLDALDRDELQGVVGHELSHVRNYDVRLMTVVAALAGAVLLLSDWSRRGLGWGGRRRRDGDGDGKGGLGILFVALWVVAVLLAPFIAQIVSLAVSRQREYLADASGAELTRNPLALASALQKISAAVAPTPSIKQGVAHLCIEDPRGGTDAERQGFFTGLWSTHPPVARRIALLKGMAYQKQP
ncbi:MAG TPA: M48 family metallopeptidase [Thermoanaerobaculia bacterium]|nr:M48 family metallopeptidase [Thermoanaerobaculia bacterium]